MGVLAIIEGIKAGTAKGFATYYRDHITDAERDCVEKHFNRYEHNVALNNAGHLDAKRRMFGEEKRDGLMWHGAAGGETVGVMLKAFKHCKISEAKQNLTAIAIYGDYGNEWSKQFHKTALKTGGSATGYTNNSGMMLAALAVVIILAVR